MGAQPRPPPPTGCVLPPASQGPGLCHRPRPRREPGRRPHARRCGRGPPTRSETPGTPGAPGGATAGESGPPPQGRARRYRLRTTRRATHGPAGAAPPGRTGRASAARAHSGRGRAPRPRLKRRRRAGLRGTDAPPATRRDVRDSGFGAPRRTDGRTDAARRVAGPRLCSLRWAGASAPSGRTERSAGPGRGAGLLSTARRPRTARRGQWFSTVQQSVAQL